MPLSDYSSVGSVSNTNSSGIIVETPFEDKDELISVDSFLQLMIAEMTSTNPFGDDSGGGANTTDYITQLAQITTMQQMQQLAYYSKGNYAMSLVGKEVTAASLGLGGKANKVTGPVEKVTLTDGDYMVYVGGKGYKLSQIMTVNSPNHVEDTGLDDLKNSQVILTSRTDESAKIRWDRPDVSDKTVLEDLTYKVYYSTDKAMDTAKDVEANGKLAGEIKHSDLKEDDTLEMNITGLEPNTTYYINVMATTANGDQYVYKKATITTKA